MRNYPRLSQPEETELNTEAKEDSSIFNHWRKVANKNWRTLESNNQSDWQTDTY